MPESLVDVARASLLEITPDDTIGAFVETVDEGDGLFTVRFESALSGYPGWAWTVSLSQITPDEEPSVLESELIPAEGALLAPDWVPWSERLADYKAAQEAEAAVELDDSDESDDDSDDDDDDDLEDDDDESEDDADEDDLLGSDVLHGGDLDGVDIDDLDVPDDESDDDSADDADDEPADAEPEAVEPEEPEAPAKAPRRRSRSKQ